MTTKEPLTNNQGAPNQHQGALEPLTDKQGAPGIP